MKNERIKKIKALLISKKTVTNTELCETFDVSIETIRRDLKILENQGMIQKIYGGVKLKENRDTMQMVEKWAVRIEKNSEYKAKIAKIAASMIPDNCTVFLDVGTTAYEVAKNLMNRKGLTVVTNSIHVAYEMGMNSAISVYLIGGIIKHDTLASTGSFANEYLTYFHMIDFAVISCDGFIPNHGTTEHSMDISIFKKNVITKSKNVIAVVDHTKLNIPCSCLCCPIEQIDTVITDSMMPSHITQQLQDMGKQVSVALV